METRRVIMNGISATIIEASEIERSEYVIDKHIKQVKYEYNSNKKMVITTGVGSLQLLINNKNSSACRPIKERDVMKPPIKEQEVQKRPIKEQEVQNRPIMEQDVQKRIETSRNFNLNPVKQSNSGKLLCIHCSQVFPGIKDVERHVCVPDKGMPSSVGERRSPEMVHSKGMIWSPLETEPTNDEDIKRLDEFNPKTPRSSGPTGKRDLKSIPSSPQVVKQFKGSSEVFFNPAANGEPLNLSCNSLVQTDKDSLVVELNKLHKCMYCEEVFVDHATLYVHTKVHWKVGQFICRTCWMRFPSKDKWRHHRMLHGTGYQCTKCRRPFATQVELKTHLGTHRGSLAINGPYIEAFGDLRHMCDYDKQTYFCYECSLCFYSQPLFNLHKSNCRHRQGCRRKNENLFASRPSSNEDIIPSNQVISVCVDHIPENIGKSHAEPEIIILD